MLTLAQRTQQALDAGFTNAQLAKAAGVTSGAVSQWLTTTKKLKAESVIGLARLTGWRVEWWSEGKLPREASTTSSVNEPVVDRNLTLSSGEISAIYANLQAPERERYVQLIVAAGFVPGAHMEVIWRQKPKEAQTTTDSTERKEAEDPRVKRFSRTGELINPSAKSGKNKRRSA